MPKEQATVLIHHFSFDPNETDEFRCATILHLAFQLHSVHERGDEKSEG